MTEGCVDIATALDTTLKHPTIEAKYQKLRLCSAQKIKSLLGTCDNQTKLKEYRGAPSDGRTATIKALKSKLRDQEFVADVLKEDVLKLRNRAAEHTGERQRLSIKQVNQDVIDQTIGGLSGFAS
jgi:predicted RNase H-like nuclease (RuvC/YqgF family)